jgi:hypothetical protein
MKTYTFAQAAKIFKTENINNTSVIYQKGTKYMIDYDLRFTGWSIIRFDIETGTYKQIAKIA